MSNKKDLNIFNYDFDWVKPAKNNSKKESKSSCCKKYKKKGEKKCKNCPKFKL